MPKRIEKVDCVIGAGIAGLTITHDLMAGGNSPLILDKGRTPGGRMATRRFEGGLFDHGLPAIEPGAKSVELIQAGTGAGILESIEMEGQTVFASPTGLSALGKYLGSTLDLKLQARAGSARREGDSVVLPVENGDGEDFEVEVTGTLFVTAPLPQAQELVGNLFGSTLTDLPNPYSRCLVGLAVLDDEADLPGGPLLRDLDGPDFERLVLEFLKFPDRAPGLSLRATALASDRLFDVDSGEQHSFFLKGYADLGIEVDSDRLQVKKWGYSQPTGGSRETHLTIDTGGVRVIVCGDAFASDLGSAVERSLASAAAALESKIG
jgi:renalase